MLSNSAWKVAIVSAIIFVRLGTGVALGHQFAFDGWIRQAVHADSSPALTATMRFATLYGAPEWLVTAAVVIVIALVVEGRNHTALLFAIAMAGATVLDIPLKLAFHRARPNPFFQTPIPSSYSFPSGHALFAACFFGFLTAWAFDAVRRVWLRMLLILGTAAAAVLIGFSRIYLGVHFPSDVLGGYAAGMAWLATMFQIAAARARPRQGRPAQTGCI